MSTLTLTNCDPPPHPGYAPVIKERAKHSRGFGKLMSDFNLSEEETRKAFVLAKSVALETFAQCFQFKILNDILFLNT